MHSLVVVGVKNITVRNSDILLGSNPVVTQASILSAVAYGRILLIQGVSCIVLSMPFSKVGRLAPDES